MIQPFILKFIFFLVIILTFIKIKRFFLLFFLIKLNLIILAFFKYLIF
jgi:hypothetical protein